MVCHRIFRRECNRFHELLVGGGFLFLTLLFLGPPSVGTAEASGLGWMIVGWDTEGVELDVASHGTVMKPIDPVSEVVLKPGDNLQNAVNANPPGTRFRLTPGIYRPARKIVPKNGMVFLGDDGAILDGGGVVDFAFSGFDHRHDNVTIRNLVIQNYVSPSNSCAIHPNPYNVQGWVVADNEVRYNAAGGICVSDNSKISGNYTHHNGQYGIQGFLSDDAEVVDNEIAFNNPNLRYDPNWNGGGTKFAVTTNLVLRNNYVHDNRGSGLWVDIDNLNTLVEQNVVEDNEYTGIYIEISYGATVRNNVVRNNGHSQGWYHGGGIVVASSSDVLVVNNLVEGNAQGIIASQMPRGSGSHGPRIIDGLQVLGNTVIMYEGGIGVVRGGGIGSQVFSDYSLQFENNRYYLLQDDEKFLWNGKVLSVDGWRDSGHDLNGEFHCIQTRIRQPDPVRRLP